MTGPKYFAFLSYAHQDAREATALSRYLETFRVPVKLGGPEQTLPKRMYPVFRDRDELSSSTDLGEAIRSALAASGALIVLCTPAAAQSRWVNEEIRTFRRVGNPQRIFPVLLADTAEGAVPPALQDGAHPLIYLRKRPREARMQLAAELLGVNEDALARSVRAATRADRLRAFSAAAAAILAIAIGVTGYESDHPKFSTLHLVGYSGFAQSDSVSIEDITQDAHDPVWFFARGKQSDIGRVAADGRITLYPIPTFTPGYPDESDLPDVVAAAPDGTLWFADNVGHRIGKLEPDGRVREYETPASRSIPGMTLYSNVAGMTAGPDGAIWFTLPGSDEGQIGRITADGHITQYPVHLDSRPSGIALGPDGALWFTDDASVAANSVLVAANTIGRITTRGRITEFALPTASADPLSITAGPDGALWFTERTANKIGRITTSGHVVEYAVPGANGGLEDIAAGPDGALWFTDDNGEIGRITTDGKITGYTVPTDTDAGPGPITAGPGRALWVVSAGVGNHIWRLSAGHWFFGI